MSYVNQFLGDVQRNEFTLWNTSYLDKPITSEDVDIDLTNYKNLTISRDMMKGMVKYYA